MSLMSRLIPSLAVLASLLTVFLLTPQQASAKVVAYKITDGFTATYPGPSGVGGVLFANFAGIPYVRGQMVLSSTPDGEGAMRIGDMIQAYATYPGSGAYTYRAKPNCVIGSSILPPTDITNIFFKTSLPHFPTNNITVRFMDWCGGPKTIGPVYIVHIDNSDQPKPFLDLPWEYEKKGLSFNTAATAINSYFDHEYPLLSTSLSEDSTASGLTRGYDGQAPPRRSYTSHDGYDYGTPAKVEYKDNALAAATGSAEYISSCGACGNAIYIDHGNRYQTRYYHLEKEGLIVATPGASVHVEKGQEIGKVGFTGNVRPKNEDGAHIHFMVVYDKNDDGNFEDNIPDGLVDPFGWQSKDPDPWENYTFNYGGVDRSGMKSTYLWTTSLSSKHVAIPSNGGNVDIDKDHKITVPAAANNNQEFELKAFLTSVVAPDSLFGVLGPGLSILAYDVIGNPITSFSSPITITFNFSEIDLSRFNLGTLFFYSSNNEVDWVKENSISIDWQNKKVTLYVTHLTDFVLMAERIDMTAPTTSAGFEGTMKPENIYLPNVSISLSASDGAGLGVDYTVYSLDDGDWKEYTSPIVVSEEGAHKITYYSVDNDDNIEEQETKEFIVEDDTTPPVTSAVLVGDLFSGTTYRSDVEITLSGSDGDGFGVDHISYNLDDNGWQNYESPLLIFTPGEHSIDFYAVDRAGNAEDAQTKSFTIEKDTTPPVTSAVLSGDVISGSAYRSDVLVSLSASDGAGFGVKKTVYNLDGGGWQNYEAPFIVLEPGEHNVQYYSVDISGNTEGTKELSFTVQKISDDIPPEITVQFDTSTKKFAYMVFDSSGSATLTRTFLDQNHEEFVATDEASNRLLASLVKNQYKILSLNTSTLAIKSLQYNLQPNLILGTNNLAILYSVDKQGKLNLLTQTFISKTYGSVVLNYDFKKNQTGIVETIGKKIVTKKQSGMRILQLSTNSGRLEYRY